MKLTIFDLLISELSTSTGEIRFTKTRTLTPMHVSSCKIETVDASDSVEFGKEPEIIPMGIGSCNAEITATFVTPKGVDASTVFPTSKLAPEIAAYYETIKIFDKIGDDDKQFALKLLDYNPSLGNGGTRELGGGTWKIKKVAMNRSAKAMGKYVVNIKLSYFWEDKSEQMLNSGITGTNIKTNCQYSIEYEGVNNDQDPKTGTCQIYNVKIAKSLRILNNATFDCQIKMYKDTVFKIYCSTDPTYVVYHGIIVDVETNPKDNIYTIKTKEIGDLLYRGIVGNPITNMVAGFIPELRVIIPCREKKDDLTINKMMKKMGETYFIPREGFEFWNPFPAVCKAPGLDEVTTLPGRDDIKISDQVMSGISIGTAVTNFLYRECGFEVWFNYESGKLEYGFLRDPIVIKQDCEIIMRSSLIDDNQEDVKPDYVVVWDPSCKFCSIAGEYGIDKHGLQYVLEDARDVAAAQALAQKILTLCTVVNRSTYSVEFPAGVVRFKEGDYFQGLGDQTLPLNEKMIYRSGTDADPLEDPGDTVWHIKEVTMTETKTTVTVGMSMYSVLDIYKSSLSRRRDGIPAPTKEQIYITSPVIVGKGADGSGKTN